MFPRISLHYKLVPVKYWEYKKKLIWSIMITLHLKKNQIFVLIIKILTPIYFKASATRFSTAKLAVNSSR